MDHPSPAPQPRTPQSSQQHPLYTVNVDGFRLAYRRSGHGHPLLLLHGGLGDSRDWLPQLDGLAQNCQVIAVDAPGCGGSADPDRDLTPAEYADLMAGFCVALGLDHADVGGLSLGSVCTLVLHRHHPRLARSLVLASAYAGWVGSLPPEEITRRQQWAAGLFERPAEQWVPEFLATVFSADTDPDIVAATAAVVRESRPASLHLLNPMAAADLHDVLPAIDVPTLLLYGELDQRSPLPVAESMHRSIAGSQLVVVPGAGHGVAVEAPERFNAAVCEFLAHSSPNATA